MLTSILETGTSFLTHDRIFLGEGLFETIRFEQQKPCYPLLHWQRMTQAAAVLGIPFDLSCNAWYEQLIRSIQTAKIDAGAVKVILGGGVAERGLEQRANFSSLSFNVFDFPLHQQPLRLVSANWRRDARNPIYQLKSVNYLESILARHQAVASGADDALFFNFDHYATETTIANLFIVKHDQLFTPLCTNGVLAGITRGRILDLCMTSGVSCIETSVDSKAIEEADAVFVTNTLQGIRSVKALDGMRIPIHHPLVALLRDLLTNDIARWIHG